MQGELNRKPMVSQQSTSQAGSGRDPAPMPRKPAAKTRGQIHFLQIGFVIPAGQLEAFVRLQITHRMAVGSMRRAQNLEGLGRTQLQKVFCSSRLLGAKWPFSSW